MFDFNVDEEKRSHKNPIPGETQLHSNRSPTDVAVSGTTDGQTRQAILSPWKVAKVRNVSLEAGFQPN